MNKSNIFENNKMKDIISEGFLSFLIKILGAVLGFIFSIILSRKFDAEGIGIYYLCISIATICVIIGKFGLDNALIKFTAIYLNKDFGGDIKRLKKDSTKFSMKISIIVLVIILFLVPIISKIIYRKESLTTPLIIMLFSIIPLILININISIMKGLRKNKIALFFESSLVSLLSIFFITILITVLHIKSINFVILFYTLACYVAFVIVELKWRSIKQEIGDTCNEKYNFEDILKVAFPLLLVASMNYVLSSTDTIMLGFWNSESDIGIYNISIKITQISSMLLVAINSVLGPKFSVLWDEGKKSELEKLIKSTTKVMGGIAILLIVILFIFAKEFLSIFGSEFIVGENILKITAVGQFIVLATGPVAVLLIMTGHEKVHRNTTVFCGILNIILNIVLIPYYGTIGAAIATTISLVFKNVYAVRAVYKYLAISIV